MRFVFILSALVFFGLPCQGALRSCLDGIRHLSPDEEELLPHGFIIGDRSEIVPLKLEKLRLSRTELEHGQALTNAVTEAMMDIEDLQRIHDSQMQLLAWYFEIVDAKTSNLNGALQAVAKLMKDKFQLPDPLVERILAATVYGHLPDASAREGELTSIVRSLRKLLEHPREEFKAALEECFRQMAMVEFELGAMQGAFDAEGLQGLRKSLRSKNMELAQLWAHMNGIAVANGTRMKDSTPVLVILPDPNTTLGRLAGKLAEQGVRLIYDPDETGSSGAYYVYNGETGESDIHLGSTSLLELRPSTSLVHEMRHWQMSRFKQQGIASPYHGSAFVNNRSQAKKTSLPGPSINGAGTYSQYISFEEIRTHNGNLAAEITDFRKRFPKSDSRGGVTAAQSLAHRAATSQGVNRRVRIGIERAMSDLENLAGEARPRVESLVINHPSEGEPGIHPTLGDSVIFEDGESQVQMGFLVKKFRVSAKAGEEPKTISIALAHLSVGDFDIELPLTGNEWVDRVHRLPAFRKGMDARELTGNPDYIALFEAVRPRLAQIKALAQAGEESANRVRIAALRFSTDRNEANFNLLLEATKGIRSVPMRSPVDQALGTVP